MKRILIVLVAAVGAPLALGAAPVSAAAAAHRSPGQRIVAVAKRYVGHARYRDGGNTPKEGFDCSGYTQYAFSRAHVAHLPHNAQAQRHAKHMHRIPARKALPGDLVFYLSGGSAYHVAVLCRAPHAVFGGDTSRRHPAPADLVLARRVPHRLALTHPPH